jgi:glycine/D-amino acid oxidase-like deaminating enzyme
VGGITECLEFQGSAEFHPLMYLEGLAAAVEKHGGKIYEGTKAWKAGKQVIGGKTNGAFAKQALGPATAVHVTD